MLDDDELKQTIRTFFMEGEIPNTNGLGMKSWDLEKNPLPEFKFDSDQILEEFTKSRMKDELGLVENPTQEQLQKIIHNRNTRTKGKKFISKILSKKSLKIKMRL